MQEYMNVSSMPKTSSFQMRINPEVKKRAEEIYANCGMTLTDAVNIFIQQSINVEGLPFLVTQCSKEALREQAVTLLMAELKKVKIPSVLTRIGFQKKKCWLNLEKPDEAEIYAGSAGRCPGNAGIHP